MIKIFLHAGHGGTDTGAVSGLKIERDINRDIVLEMVDILKKSYSKSITPYLMKETIENSTHNSNSVVNFANSIKDLDIALDIHCNSGGGLGFECYVGKSGLCNIIGNLFCATMQSIDVNIRGVKTRLSNNGKDYYYFIRELTSPSIILETCFIDNEKDIDITQEKNIKAVANAYVRAIVNYFQVYSDSMYSENSKELYHVQIGAFRNKENAETLKTKLEKLGFDVYITKY